MLHNFVNYEVKKTTEFPPLGAKRINIIDYYHNPRNMQAALHTKLCDWILKKGTTFHCIDEEA